VSERGAAGVVLLAVVVVAMAMTVVVADIGGYLAARLQAVAAADAAALAAAPITFAPFGAGEAPAVVAAEIAAANGARLVECRCPVDRTWAPRRVDVVAVHPVSLVLFGALEVRGRGAADFDPRALVDS
jgi:hypothetical protein